MQHITDIFGNSRIVERFKANGKRASSERALLIGEIAEKTGYTIGRVCLKTAGMKENDLYYLLSVMKDGVATKSKSSYKHAFNSALFIPKRIINTSFV